MLKNKVLLLIPLLMLVFSVLSVAPASAHTAVHAASSHAHVVLTTDKKKKPKKKHHSTNTKLNDGIDIVARPVQENDIDTPTNFLVIGSHLTPRAIYDINLDSFNLDRCDAAVIMGALAGVEGSGLVGGLPFDGGEDGLLANSVLPAIVLGVGTADIRADTEGRVTFTVVILNCIGTNHGAGDYSISIINDARSGERDEVHVPVISG